MPHTIALFAKKAGLNLTDASYEVMEFKEI